MILKFFINPVFIFWYYILLLITISFYLIKKKRTFILILVISTINIILLFGIDDFRLSTEKTLLHIYQALCMFFGALDYSDIITIAKNNAHYDYLRLIIPLQFCVSILYSITFTISYFSFLLDKWVYFFLKKDIFIFSHLNPQSMTLANDIYHQNKNSNIIFCHIDDHSQYFKIYLKELKKINALLIDKSVKDISLDKQASLFLISNNDITNIHLLNQISQKTDKRKISDFLNSYMQKIPIVSKIVHIKEKELIIYPFIKQRNHEIYADSTVELKTPVKVINEVDLIINDILLHQPPLPADNHIHIIIIGAGKIGTRFLKALYWYCTFPNVKVSITVITPHCHQTIHELSCDCPEIFNDKTRENNTFTIRNSKKIIFQKFDVRNRDFINYIDNNDFDYYFVALGDDNLNAQTSIKIRQSLAQRYFSKDVCFSKPIITIVMDNNLNSIISNMKTFTDLKKSDTAFYNYKIDCYGRYDEIYSWAKIISNPLLKAGTKVFVNRDDNSKSNETVNIKQNDFQCNHRSNVAFVLHIQGKLHILAKNQYHLTADTQKKNTISFAEALKEHPCDLLPQIEHERWRCFYETEGFQYVDDETIRKYKSHFGLKNYLAKLHPALCDQDELLKRRDEFNTNYFKNDINLISNIDQIIENELIITKNEEQSNE